MLDRDLSDSNGGLGPFSEHAAAVRTAASTKSASFGVRRATEVAHLLTSDMDVDLPSGVVSTKVVRQKNDQAGVGTPAFFASTSSLG